MVEIFEKEDLIKRKSKESEKIAADLKKIKEKCLFKIKLLISTRWLSA